jgi:hypothetical protein
VHSPVRDDYTVLGTAKLYPHLIVHPVGDIVLYVTQNIAVVAPCKDVEVVILNVVEADRTI